MLIFLLLFLFSRQTAPKQANPAMRIVHVTDPGLVPVAGAKVAVKGLFKKARPITVFSDGDGSAKFRIEADNDYAVEVKLFGFKTKHLERAHVSKPSETSPATNVEFHMELSGRMVTVHGCGFQEIRRR